MIRRNNALHILLTSMSALTLAACATTGGAPTLDAPQNIIVFIGDGMGVSTVTAGRIFDGQSKGMMGEEHELIFETFPEVALIKTYNTNSQVPDSAGTATAILSGYKTNIGAINVPPNADPVAMMAVGCGTVLPDTLTEKAKAAGKRIGIVSTARLTHATPAAVYAHSADRGLESETDLEPPMIEDGCRSISQQLVTSDVDLALGGGASQFTEAQRDLWPGEIVTTKAELMAADTNARLLGLFKESHMSYEADRAGTDEPSLADMTRQAIERLDSVQGYVLMIEAGRVDHAHHGSNAYRALRDMQALNTAVQTALTLTDDDTMIVVTADHSHVFTMAGYPKRGNPILGLVETAHPDEDAASPYDLAEDGKPYTTLGYQNGPNIRELSSPTLTQAQVLDPDYQQQTAVQKQSETHAGEDVPLYATGPGSELFGGVMEQNEIGQIIERLLNE